MKTTSELTRGTKPYGEPKAGDLLYTESEDSTSWDGVVMLLDVFSNDSTFKGHFEAVVLHAKGPYAPKIGKKDRFSFSYFKPFYGEITLRSEREDG